MYPPARDTWPIIPIKESDAELRARVEYVTGLSLDVARGEQLDEIAQRYGLKRRCKP